jgi:signal transduction histidine kinase/CHASE2 domain-containing sensor protein
VRRLASQVIPSLIILLVSMSAVMAVTLLVPSLSAATTNMLFRRRGAELPPDDIIIVAIDDASLQQVGNWPWPRSVMAATLKRITGARPRAVGLDVIYAEASDPAEDQLLVEAIKGNGRVVLPAQLAEVEAAQPDLRGSSAWLLPLPEIKDAAAAIGHAHADPDVDGVLRTIQLSKADAQGERRWAFGLETLRVAEQLPPGELEEQAGALRLGRYEIAIHDEAEQSSLPGVRIIRPNEMYINYLGPPRAFHYYSIADVLNDKVPASVFTDRIVLIGAVAQTMGDTRITPFISYGGASGIGMPGVEVHANIIETIRRGAWLRPLPDWLSFGLALLVILCASAIVRWLDGWRAAALLGALLSLIVVGSLYAFNRYFIIPPLVPMLTGFFSIVPLLLLNGSVTASRDLDRKLERLARIQQSFMSRTAPEESLSAALSFLGSILKAETVALFHRPSRGRTLRLKACFGLKPDEGETLAASNAAVTNEARSHGSLLIKLADEAELSGVLLIKRKTGEPFSESERQMAREFAGSLASELRAAERGSRLQERELPVSLPHNITWKLRAVDDITAHLIARVGFMNRVFSSMTEGLLVADMTGQVVFANTAAVLFWQSLETEALTGKSLGELFVARGIMALDVLHETMREALDGRSVQMDVELSGPEGRFYTLQFSTVIAGDHPASETVSQPDAPEALPQENPRVIGLIVIINDITKRRELERVKAETLQLVSHELRTPLTSIQGLSELLMKYPVPEGESQESLEMIYSEAVRMNELINRYLDITRIESGAQTLTRQPVAANVLISGCVRSLSSLAAEKRIQVRLKLEEPEPLLPCDAQLLTQAINNLLSNAIKYSPFDSQIEVGSAKDDGRLRIYVRDEGYGVPKEFQGRVFEKFYRLERDAKSETIGTGLGLPLVKEIIERHGGVVTLESEPHQGSTFTIRLPLQRT